MLSSAQAVTGADTGMVLARITGQDNGLNMRSFARRIHVRLAWTAGAVLVAAVSISVALLVTPMQQVALVGQSVSVGAAAPSLSLSGPGELDLFGLSGPGELDLFGQRLPTTLRFDGPVRPRLALTQIT